MCARVCPTETLCEEACVREAAEGKPVEIGRLQRFATDPGDGPWERATRYTRAATPGRKNVLPWSVRGAGGPGLCAPAGDARAMAW